MRWPKLRRSKDAPMLGDVPSKGVVYSYMNPEVDVEREIRGAPEHVAASLAKSASGDQAFHPRMSMQAWEEMLYAPLADGAAQAAAAEATIFPIFTLPANYLYPGRIMKWTVMGRSSSAITTPGTFTYRLSYSATGLGAVALVASSAFIPDVTAAATNLTFMLEYWTVCRASGTAGSSMSWGRLDIPDANDVDITNFVIEYEKRLAPAATPAAVAIDTTVARALNPTYQPSLGTASMTGHVGILEAMT